MDEKRMERGRKDLVKGFKIRNQSQKMIKGLWLKEMGIEGYYEDVEVKKEDL